MEFYIRNNYIKKFLSNYSNQNQLKIIKYLTLVGIQHLQETGRGKLPYGDLKQIAKDISKTVPKEDKQLNKQLNIIKDELAKLNEKFEDKLRTMSLSPQNLIKDGTYPRSISAQRDHETRQTTKKMPTTCRDGEIAAFNDAQGRRANSNEPIPHQAQKSKSAVTLKPTQVVFPLGDPRENRNFVTKHHLDDTEAKKAMDEEGIIYFPQKEKEEERRKQQEILQAKYNPQAKTKPATNKTKKPSRSEKENKGPRARPADENQHDISIARSERVDGYRPKPLQPHNQSELRHSKVHEEEEDFNRKPNIAQNTFGPAHHKTGSKHQKAKHSKTQKPSHDAKDRTNISRLNQTQFDQHREYNEVESKIKDEVQYHKKLSKQYKKMKESMKNFDNYDSYANEEVSGSSSQKNFNGHEYDMAEREERPAPRHRQSQEMSYYQSNYYDNSKLLDSASSARKSMNLPRYSNQFLDRTVDYPTSAAKQRRTEMTAKNEDLSYYRSLGGENQGGILDIANSFLNSPLMQHLSNIDSKDSDETSKDSSPNAEHSKHLASNTRVHHFDSKSPSGYIRSPNKRYEIEEDLRRIEPQSVKNKTSHQHKYSDWVGVYKADEGKESYSMLKESDNKRYTEGPSKDSRAYYSKDDTSSLSSSAFSNYLNDEMKDFFQKETYELNRGKTSKSISKHAAGSRNPPNISFHTNEGHHTLPDASFPHSRKITYQNQFDTNKSYSGFPSDNPNIFRNERMSVTRLFNNP